MQKIITHNGMFHADDVFGVATLALVYNDQIEIIRTRDDAVIDTGDVVLDVGRTYIPEQNRFDHHQEGGAGKRQNDIPYAAFGLIWKHFGEKLVSSPEAHRKVDESIVQPIDANDTGYWSSEAPIKDFDNYVMDKMIKGFNLSWTEGTENIDEEALKRFKYLVNFAKEVIKREIMKAEDNISARIFVEEAYEKAEDKRILILENHYPWKEVALEKEEPLYIVQPDSSSTNWMVSAVPVRRTGYDLRKALPENWRAKANEELEKASGVSGAVFCHASGFLGVAKTKEGALLLAQKAVEA